MSDINTSIAKLLLLYKDNPIGFSRDIVGIELSKQQEALISLGVKDNARVACKSATGTGKTCVLALLVLHQLITQEDIKIIATSPSAGQLSRGLRSELGKLHRQMLPEFQSLYRLTQEKIMVVGHDDVRYCSLVTGSAENKESLAGVHAKKVIILVDESSSISQEIYDTLIGNLTTDGSSLIQTSNPVRPTGPFANLWRNPENKKIWKLLTFTAFDSPNVSPEWIELVKTEYGEDSDFYRMRVLGKFPRASSETFISSHEIEAASSHVAPLTDYRHHAKVIGVDVARFGDDSSIFVLRQGSKVLDIKKFNGVDTMELTAHLCEYQHMHQASSLFIDAIGVGAGVFDRAKELGLPAVDVVVSSKPSDPKRYCNLRSELWGLMRDWLKNDADIPQDLELKEQLGSMQYGYNGKMQIQLLSKRDMKKRLKLQSPDIADALALTFAASTFAYAPRSRMKRKIKRTNYLWI